MQSLTELCLNEIEASGAHTRELAKLPNVLPKRMWSRHPILKVSGSCISFDRMIDCVDDIELVTEIEVIYTGVYTMKCNIHVAHYLGGKLEKGLVEKIYAALGLSGPIKYEKMFESLEGEIPQEHTHWLENGCFNLRRASSQEWIAEAKRRAERNLLAAEIGYALLKQGRGYEVELSLEGPVELSLGHWEDEVENYWLTFEQNISQALDFIKAYVSV